MKIYLLLVDSTSRNAEKALFRSDTEKLWLGDIPLCPLMTAKRPRD